VIYQTMSRQEADEKVTWLENQLTVTLTAWQKDIFAAMLMYPDVPFDVRIPRAGRG
jgi:hypothetical protein